MPQTKISKKLSITKYIQGYFLIFDKRSYQSFKKIIEGIIKIRDWNQTDLAQFSEKSISAIQYFFGKGQDVKWEEVIKEVDCFVCNIRNSIHDLYVKEKKENEVVSDFLGHAYNDDDLLKSLMARFGEMSFPAILRRCNSNWNQFKLFNAKK